MSQRPAPRHLLDGGAPYTPPGSSLAGALRPAPLLAALFLLTFGQAAWAADRHAVTGMVLAADPARRTFVASIDSIPGFMEAMTMSFAVRDAKELRGVVPGAIVDFTLVVDKSSSYVEGIRIRRYQGLEQDPLAARRLSLFKEIVSGRSAKMLPIGAPVPDFTLTDHQYRRLTLSQLRGKVVAINFMYTTCQLPDFCLRVVNHFGVLQKRFKEQLGRELMLLTITFDPARDQPDVLNRYARQWNPDPDTWRFLTGSVPEVQRVLEMFGVSAFPNEGLMDHSLHSVFVDRDGKLVANIEGNQYSSDQLVDLTRTVLKTRPRLRQRLRRGRPSHARTNRIAQCPPPSSVVHCAVRNNRDMPR